MRIGFGWSLKHLIFVTKTFYVTTKTFFVAKTFLCLVFVFMPPSIYPLLLIYMSFVPTCITCCPVCLRLKLLAPSGRGTTAENMSIVFCQLVLFITMNFHSPLMFSSVNWPSIQNIFLEQCMSIHCIDSYLIGR